MNEGSNPGLSALTYPSMNQESSRILDRRFHEPPGHGHGANVDAARSNERATKALAVRMSGRP